MIYSARKNGNEHGTVYTDERIVDFIFSVSNISNLTDVLSKKILEPSAGEGAFVEFIVKKILDASNRNEDLIRRALNNITVVEIDLEKINIILERLHSVFRYYSLDFSDYRDSITIINFDFLTVDLGKFDVIVGNPPYVRYDKIPNEKRDIYRKKYKCFKNRCDIYIPFFEKCLSLLNTGAVLTFICTDRWINNQYGACLRKEIYENYNFSKYIKISGFNPFSEEVLAYPAIFSISNSNSTGLNFAEISNFQNLNIDYFEKNKKNFTFDLQGNINYGLKNTKCTLIEEQGFKIGIGVATGADKIFIVNKNNVDIESDVFLPILMRKDLKNKRISWNNRFLINPYKKDRLIDLNLYPKLQKYFEQNSQILKSRYVAKKNTKNWYKTIDRIDEALVKKPKLLIPDISSDNSIYYDQGNFYPHHNFYYITGNSPDDLLVLQAILSTDYVKTQVRQKGLTMNGGALRWQAQTLRKVLIPNIKLISDSDRKLIINNYKTDFSNVEKTLLKYIV